MKKSFTPLEIPIVNSKKTKSLTGFTLIELLVVIVIIAIISSFGLQQYKIIMSKARGTEAMNLLSALGADGLKYYSAYGSFPEIVATDGKLNGPVVSIPQNTAYFTFSVIDWISTPERQYGWITLRATANKPLSDLAVNEIYEYNIIIFIGFSEIGVKSVIIRYSVHDSPPPQKIDCGSLPAVYEYHYYVVKDQLGSRRNKAPWPGM
ncbi:MAG: prepilin-type N-terminal cleavage/methylation domain-containing protein [Candidatus Omnitrophica bacterium]|nr:prepilin-type N-terminal cleavage/methylation domain-containing protein [Candidatus Omnitrophota bacterium]